MGLQKVTVKKYGFKAPPILSEAEFISYKQIFMVEPEHNLAPNLSFWDEFAFIKWLLILIIGSILISFIWESFFEITMLFGLMLIFGLLYGAESMINYQSFLGVKNDYYRSLKHAILSSKDYSEFIKKATEL